MKTENVIEIIFFVKKYYSQILLFAFIVYVMSVIVKLKVQSKWPVKYCRKCRKRTKHRPRKNTCVVCGREHIIFTRKNNNNFYAKFSREDFYNVDIKDIAKSRFTDKNEIVKINGDFSKYYGVSGVWSVWAGRKCIDVCQTVNIGREMRNWMISYEENRGKTNKQLDKLNETYNYNRKKKRDMHDKYGRRIHFRVNAVNIGDKHRRERIESMYAHRYRAEFWNPAPGYQMGLVYRAINRTGGTNT